MFENNNNSNNSHWFSTMLISWVNRRQVNKNIKRIYTANCERRNVTEYKPCSLEDFFNPNDKIGGLLVSGENDELRIKAESIMAVWAYNKGIPVIILHENNMALEQAIQQIFMTTHNCYVLNSSNPLYDPFVGLTDTQIHNLIINSADVKREIKVDGKYYIDGMTKFIRSKNIQPYCYMYCTCPHYDLFNKIDAAERNGQITTDQAFNIKSLLKQGQGERAAIEMFFDTLGSEAAHILAKRGKTSYARSIQSVYDLGGVASIDIMSASNSILINVIANEIKNVLTRNKPIVVILDSITVKKNEGLYNLLKNSPQKCHFAVCSKDIYSMLNDDDLFKVLLSSSSKYIIMRHISEKSSEKISESFGQYDIDEVSQTMGGHGMFHGDFGYGANKSINVNRKRESVIKPEEIRSLSDREVYVYDALNKETAHTIIQ